jgi:hypothetical protein
VDELVRQATTARFHDAFHRLRKTFARIGVVVVCAEATTGVASTLTPTTTTAALSLRTMNTSPSLIR